MKSFALSLFATTALGVRSGTQVIDLTDLSKLKDSYLVKTGEAIKFKLHEDTDGGSEWFIDDRKGLKVTSSYKENPLPPHVMGASGVRTFTVYAGSHP